MTRGIITPDRQSTDNDTRRCVSPSQSARKLKIFYDTKGSGGGGASSLTRVVIIRIIAGFMWITTLFFDMATHAASWRRRRSDRQGVAKCVPITFISVVAWWWDRREDGYFDFATALLPDYILMLLRSPHFLFLVTCCMREWILF